jgi:nucleotide-binding universal stress UspA family protein
MSKILVATDGSLPSVKGIEQAVQVAKERNADLIALYVDTAFANASRYALLEAPNKDRLGLKRCDAGVDVCSILEKHHREAGKSESLIVGEAGLEIAEFLAEKQGVKVKTMVVRGQQAATTIVDIAAREQVDMIVIGSKGLTGLDKILIGSVADKVARGASCPVLIVR